MEAQLIPRREVLAQIERAGYPVPSDDQIDRWDEAGLLCEPPSVGTSRRYGYTPGQVARLIAIARIIARFDSARPRTAEIAFWLCFEGGGDVPIDLVCEHLKRAMETFQSSTYRILNELGRRNEGHHIGIAGVANKLGGLLARQAILKLIPSLERSSLAREVIGTFITLFLFSSANPNEYATVARDVRKATTILRRDSEPPPEPLLRRLFDIVADFSQFLRVDKGNPALAAIEQIRHSGDMTSAFWAVEFGNRGIAAAGMVFPWMSDPSKAPSLSPKDHRVVGRWFAPVICAIFTTLRDNEVSKGIAAQLRAGNTEEVMRDLRNLKQVTDDISSAIAFKGADDEK